MACIKINVFEDATSKRLTGRVSQVGCGISNSLESLVGEVSLNSPSLSASVEIAHKLMRGKVSLVCTLAEITYYGLRTSDGYILFDGENLKLLAR